MTRPVTRRFNYTRRLEIPSSAAEIEVRIDAGKPVALLMKLKLPEPGPHPRDEWSEARVWLEAWRTDIGAFQRFEIGTTASIAGRVPVFSARLSEFPDDQNLAFRVKVVSSSSKRILAEADRLEAAKDASQRDELIRVIPTDLGELPWSVDWSDLDEGPRILVNSNIERNRDLLTRDAVVSGLVVPAVLREVLFRAATAREADDVAWVKRWKEFGIRTSGIEPPVEADGCDTWVADVVAKFASIHRLSTLIDEHFKKSEGIE
jgi:hypothetical protein